MRLKLAAAVHSDYAKLTDVPSAWQKFVADVFCYAAVLVWE